MNGDDGRKKYIIDKKFTLYVGLFLILIVVSLFFIRKIDNHPNKRCELTKTNDEDATTIVIICEET